MLRWRRLGFRWGAGSGYKNRGRCVRGQAGVGPPFEGFRLGRRRPSGNSIELGSLDCGPAEGVGAKVLSARAAEMRCVSISVRGEHTFIMLGA